MFTQLSTEPHVRNEKKEQQQQQKQPGDIIILHCSLDMVDDRCNYFSFWAIFVPLKVRKIKISKK